MSQDRKEMINRKGEKEVLLRKRNGEVEYLSFPGIEKTGLVNHMFTTRKGGVKESVGGLGKSGYYPFHHVSVWNGGGAFSWL